MGSEMCIRDRYEVGASILMNFTVLDMEGNRVSGLLPDDISAFIDGAEISSSLLEDSGSYYYTYTAVEGDHNVSVIATKEDSTIYNSRGFSVR